ncbi:MAG: cytochrome C oxidase subunit IV family protein [Acidobacteriota bacterium]
MSDYASHRESDGHAGPGYGMYVAVWAVLLALTALLVLLSRFGQRAAVAGLLTITPVKAALVFYYFMHLRYERALLKGVLIVTLGTLLIFFGLTYADVAFR